MPSAAESAASDGVEIGDRIRVAVLSDIHATKDGEPVTNVAESTGDNLDLNALSAAIDALPTLSTETDLIICPGDLVHEGKTAPMGWVWKQLHHLADALDAPLIASAGNHDLLLKPTGGDKPEKALRALKPEFPHRNRECVKTYWSHEVAIVEGNGWRVVTINSSASMGGYDKKEAEWGRYGTYCRAELPRELEAAESVPPVNIAVCHHHPQEWTDDSDTTTNHMLRGDLLIDLLEGRRERWMLIHGHKHHPRLDYLGQGSGGPVRLASGSVGADLLGDRGTSVRNQMHVIDFDLDARDFGLTLAGHVHSWDWDPGVRWIPSGPKSGLPHRSSFGYRRDGAELAHWLGEEAEARDKKTWTWDEICDLEPRCRYLADCDFAEFIRGVRNLGGGVQEELREVTFA